MFDTFPGVELFDAFLEGFDIASVVAGGGLADFKGDAALVDDIFHEHVNGGRSGQPHIAAELVKAFFVLAVDACGYRCLCHIMLLCYLTNIHLLTAKSNNF